MKVYTKFRQRNFDFVQDQDTEPKNWDFCILLLNSEVM